MKKSLSITIGLMSLFCIFTACSDEAFLTEEPKTIYTKENAFEKSTQVDAVLVGAYDQFNTLHGYVISFFNPFPANFLHGDGSDVLGSTQGNSGVSSGFNNYWALRSNNNNFLQTWNTLYQIASLANLALTGLEQVEGIDAGEATYLAAQAKFFRGWAYLYLGEMFGGVPLVEQFMEELKFDYARSTREETYTFAINDLTEAAAGLPAYPKENGRVAQGVAKHFLAEAYLARGIETQNNSDYDMAISAANDVIAAHPLMTSRFGSRSEFGSQPAGIPDNGVQRYRPDGNVYYDLFQIGNYAYSSGNTESLMIYELATYDKTSVYGGAVMQLAVICGPAYRDKTWGGKYVAENLAAGAGGGPWMQNIDGNLFPGQQLGVHLTGSWGLIGAMDYTDEYVWRDQFSTDMRNEQINRYNPVVMDKKSPYYLQTVTKDMLNDPPALSRVSAKITTWDIWGWNLDHCSSMGVFYCNQYGRDWYIARSAETYLLRAEAKLRKGDNTGAAADINAVRARANASYMYSAGEVDLYTILDERARELSWEEMRWPTLLRMGGHGENEVMHTQLENHSLGTEDTEMFKGQAFPSWTLFPIPFSVIDLNSGAVLEQNPGWD